MTQHYTTEKTVQVLIGLLKEHGIKKVIASPGTASMAFVGSIQNDSHFEVYSSVDERSAAYLACGLAAESGEPVVIACTGATASRNYMPGLTEAYYRKLPVLAITATQAVSRIGHHIAQVIDRSSMPNDTVRHSVTLPVIKDDDDLWDCEIKTNRALLELTRHGGGPVHINMPTIYSRSWDVKELPKFRVIRRFYEKSELPVLPEGKIAISIGSHTTMSDELTEAIDRFCAANNAVVFCDHTSAYKGKYRLQFALVTAQKMLDSSAWTPDLLIHLGEITGDYYTLSIKGKQVWRVNEDGEIRDTYRRLRYVFEMTEQAFFEHYSKSGNASAQSDYLQSCQSILKNVRQKVSEVVFSNVWLASQMAHRIPEGSVVHFGILNSLRTWNFFEFPKSVTSASNVGGFGIDGGVSSLVGASLSNQNKLYFGVIGDLAFFYDMNVLGNRHLGSNVRILLVNNGKGIEFRHSDNSGSLFGDVADKYIAAGGHFGNQSRALVRNYAESLGFEYISASDKQEFKEVYERFLSPEIADKPMLFEVFTNSEEEAEALDSIATMATDVKSRAKSMVRNVLGKRGIAAVKKTLGR